MNVIAQAVKNQIEDETETPVDDAFGVFDVRPERLVWKETEDGILYVGDSARNPESVVRIELNPTNPQHFDTLVLDEEPDSWNDWTVLSEPGSAVAEPQYD